MPLTPDEARLAAEHTKYCSMRNLWNDSYTEYPLGNQQGIHIPASAEPRTSIPKLRKYPQARLKSVARGHTIVAYQRGVFTEAAWFEALEDVLKALFGEDTYTACQLTYNHYGPISVKNNNLYWVYWTFLERHAETVAKMLLSYADRLDQYQATTPVEVLESTAHGVVYDPSEDA
jgi:hypothetical protein